MGEIAATVTEEITYQEPEIDEVEKESRWRLGNRSLRKWFRNHLGSQDYQLSWIKICYGWK